MHIHTTFDPSASELAGHLTFYCDRYELTREDIADFKAKKLLKFVNEDDLPESIRCQVLVQCESVHRAKLTFFSPTFELPEAVLDDPFLNRDLIASSRSSGGFALEVSMPLKDSGIGFDFSYEG